MSVVCVCVKDLVCVVWVWYVCGMDVVCVCVWYVAHAHMEREECQTFCPVML